MKYVKLDHRDHVLKRPDMYIGSVKEDTQNLWILNSENMMFKKNISITPGLYKIIDEIIVNAIDHVTRVKVNKGNYPVKNIKVKIYKKEGVIEVFNDGDGIDIITHEEDDNMYIPEMIFGHLLTSTNYDENEERTIGGQNGIGAKACNIFSRRFKIETVDHIRKLIYKQLFEKNMSVINTPEVKKTSCNPYTKIIFEPDYKKLNMPNGLTDDMYNIIVKRVYDICATTDVSVSVYLNDEKLPYNSFEKYVSLYIPNKKTIVKEKLDNDWEIIVTDSPSNSFEQVSFVNGIWTINGGKHVDAVTNNIVKALVDMISKKHKIQNLQPKLIKDMLFVFIKSVVVNPTFNSQSKEVLTNPLKDLKFNGLSDKFIKDLYKKTDIVERVLAGYNNKIEKSLQKTDGKKRTKIKGLPKLEDANLAGTYQSRDCTLILTEGDSSATMAIAGVSAIGRDKYGVFPLKGKILNVKDATSQKIVDNAEITNIKRILGLQSNKKYTNISDLRYGKVMLLTDQDTDGSHIKGLLFNMFDTLWPELIREHEYLVSMLTPIVKVKKEKKIIQFYSLTDYEEWAKSNNTSGWEIKYYKGLGTSSSKEARDYFKEMKKVNYKWTEESQEALDLAFNKKRANDRKNWLHQYSRVNVLDYTNPDVTYTDFIHKDLIHFSNYDVQRSIPSVIDGLKISQRKIMYCCFKRNLVKNEIRVAQLASYVSEHSSYHHGETSLQMAIINMAQDFTGSNNINLLMPNGQFGSRIQMGSDAGQPRYINTQLSADAVKIFDKNDFDIIEYLEDDGNSIEPSFYVPIIPMILINGALGIGTGFSTNIPCYNPKDIINLLKLLINGESIDSYELVPWYRGFKGEIFKKDSKYYSRGVFKRINDTIYISELPISTGILDFKCLLEDLESSNVICGYTNKSSDNNVSFTVTVNKDDFDTDTVLKLTSSKRLSTTNMYAFNEKGAIQKFNSAIEILKYFFSVRTKYYQKRKDHMIKKIEKELSVLSNKIRFIEAVINKEIIVYDCTKSNLEKYLTDNTYDKNNDSYDYIIKIPIYSFTIDKVKELKDLYKKQNCCYNNIKNESILSLWTKDLENYEF